VRAIPSSNPAAGESQSKDVLCSHSSLSIQYTCLKQPRHFSLISFWRIRTGPADHHMCAEPYPRIGTNSRPVTTRDPDCELDEICPFADRIFRPGQSLRHTAYYRKCPEELMSFLPLRDDDRHNLPGPQAAVQADAASPNPHLAQNRAACSPPSSHLSSPTKHTSAAQRTGYVLSIAPSLRLLEWAFTRTQLEQLFQLNPGRWQPGDTPLPGQIVAQEPMVVSLNPINSLDCLGPDVECRCTGHIALLGAIEGLTGEHVERAMSPWPGSVEPKEGKVGHVVPCVRQI
jgi:hypothetical protein